MTETQKPVYVIKNLWYPPEVGKRMTGYIFGHFNVREGGLGRTSPVVAIRSESLIETKNSLYIIEPEEAPASEDAGEVPEQIRVALP